MTPSRSWHLDLALAANSLVVDHDHLVLALLASRDCRNMFLYSSARPGESYYQYDRCFFTEVTLVPSDSQCSSSDWFHSLRRVDRHRCHSTKSTPCRCRQGGTSGNIPPCSCCRTRATGCHCCSRSIRSCRPARRTLICCCFQKLRLTLFSVMQNCESLLSP